MTNKEYLHGDIHDSPEDEAKLKGENASFDLPEIKDIPGAAAALRHASETPGDVTISSADEEADELLEGDDDLGGSNVSSLEKKLLRDSFDPSYDTDLPVNTLSLDDKDNEGDPLEESTQKDDLFGEDLDSDLVEEEDEEADGEKE